MEGEIALKLSQQSGLEYLFLTIQSLEVDQLRYEIKMMQDVNTT